MACWQNASASSYCLLTSTGCCRCWTTTRRTAPPPARGLLAERLGQFVLPAHPRFRPFFSPLASRSAKLGTVRVRKPRSGSVRSVQDSRFRPFFSPLASRSAKLGTVRVRKPRSGSVRSVPPGMARTVGAAGVVSRWACPSPERSSLGGPGPAPDPPGMARTVGAAGVVSRWACPSPERSSLGGPGPARHSRKHHRGLMNMIFITTIPHHGAPQCKSQPDTSRSHSRKHHRGLMNMIFITTIPHHGAPQCKSQPDTRATVQRATSDR